MGGALLSMHIVVGVDGSEHARTALAWARVLAHSAPSPHFHLVHAVPVITGAELSPMHYARVVESVMAEGESVLAAAADQLKGSDVRVYLRQGAAAVQILSVAREVGAGLITVGSRGLGRASRFFLGSVSNEVVHGAQAPVLVVRGQEPRQVRKVLVGVDGSVHSQRALQFAARWAPEAEIVGLNVVHVSPEARTAIESLDVPLEASVLHTGRETVAAAVRASGVGLKRVQVLTAVGAPVEQLVAHCRSQAADLLVVGSRGLGFLGEFLLGSVSEGCLRLASCPVVVIR